MKKSLIILTAVVLVAACFSFVACSNLPAQEDLSHPWKDYKEEDTYIVSEKDGENLKDLGELKVSYTQYERVDQLDLFASHVDGAKLRYNKIKPSYVEKNFFGLIIVTRLDLKDGQYKDSILVSDKMFRVKYSYSISHFKDEKASDGYQDIEVVYDYTNADKKTVNMKYQVEGDIKVPSTEVKLKPFRTVAYFDNAAYIAITRALGPINVSRQLSFMTHSYRENKMLKRVATNTGKDYPIELHKDSEIKLDKFDYPKKEEPKPKAEDTKPEDITKTKVICKGTSIASAETMPGSGTPIIYYVASFPYKYSDTLKANKLLIRFEEHGIIYNLKSVKITPYSTPAPAPEKK